VGYTIAALLGLLLLLILIALFLKTTYRVEVKKEGLEEKLKYNVQFSWLSGIIKRSLLSEEAVKEEAVKKEDAKPTSDRPAKSSKSSQRKQKKEKQEGKKEKKKKFSMDLGDLGMNGIANIIGYSITLLKKIFVTFRPKKAAICGRYGAKEPDTTGLVLAASYALAALLPFPMHIEPDFEKEEMQFDIQLIGYFRLWAITVPIVKYILKPEIWGLIFPKKAKRKPKTKVKTKNNLEVDENGNRI